jgi:hypothetical protein
LHQGPAPTCDFRTDEVAVLEFTLPPASGW